MQGRILPPIYLFIYWWCGVIFCLLLLVWTLMPLKAALLKKFTRLQPKTRVPSNDVPKIHHVSGRRPGEEQEPGWKVNRGVCRACTKPPLCYHSRHITHRLWTRPLAIHTQLAVSGLRREAVVSPNMVPHESDAACRQSLQTSES